MMKIFVDESGDLGTKERFFVIALIIPQNSNRIKNIIKHHCIQYGHDESKASLLSFPMKQAMLKKLCKIDDHSISYIIADKTLVTNQKLFEDKNLLYNYLFQLLIRPIIQSADTDIDILLDNHSLKVKSVNSLSDYIKIKAYAEWGFSHNISIKYIDSKNSKQVQMADLVANVIYAHYLYKKDLFYCMLKIKMSLKFPWNTFNK